MEYFRPGNDVFRMVPWRYIGYAFPMFEMVSWNNDENDPTNDPWTVTATFICLHGVYTFVVATVEASSSSFICPIPNRFLYVAVAMVESFVWDAIATIVMPYSVGYLIYHLLHNVAFASMEPANPIRKYSPRAVGILSMIVLSPLLDQVCDNLIGLVINRYSVC